MQGYMESLEEEDDERFKKQFASYLADDIGSEDLEEIYTNCHAAIREDPMRKKKEHSAEEIAEFKKAARASHPKKLTYEQRKQRVQEKKEAYARGDLE